MTTNNEVGNRAMLAGAAACAMREITGATSAGGGLCTGNAVKAVAALAKEGEISDRQPPIIYMPYRDLIKALIDWLFDDD